MYPFLTRLGIPNNVQQYFSPYYRIDQVGNLRFAFGSNDEVFGPGIHRIPATEELWMAGDQHDPTIRMVIFTHSAMEAIAFVSINRYTIPAFDRCLFISFGSGLYSSQLSRIRRGCEGRSCAFVFGKDLFGHIADVKAAAALCKMPVTVSVICNEQLEITFRCRDFTLNKSFSALMHLKGSQDIILV
jgi:hypothetical protein